jgi:hypothetical protein
MFLGAELIGQTMVEEIILVLINIRFYYKATALGKWGLKCGFQ